MAPKPDVAPRRMLTFVITLLVAGAILAGIYAVVSSPGEVHNAPPAGQGNQDP